MSQSRISITFRDISLAAVGDDIGNGDMVGFFKSFDNIQYAVTDAGTQIENGGAFVFLCVFNGFQVAGSQIHDVDIIAHAGTVMGGIIVAKDLELF